MLDNILRHWWVGAEFIVLTLYIHYLVLALRGHKTVTRKVARTLHWHALGGVVVMTLSGIALGVAIVHGLGAVKPRVHVTAPPPVAGLPSSYSVEWAMPPVQDQGGSEACVAFATDEALWAERRIRGEALPYSMPSPFYQYWYNTYGRNVGTSIDGEALAAFQHGMIPYSWLPSLGPAPSYWDTSHAAGYGGSYRYLFSGSGGWNGIYAIEAALASNQPVVLLLDVRTGFYNASYGQTSTDDSGDEVGGHGIVAVAYDQYGDIKIRNSWGTGWAASGDIWLTPSAILNHVYAAAVVTPGAITWPAPRPTATPLPTPRPTVTPVHTKTRHVRPHKAHRRARTLLVVHTMALRAKPALRASYVLTARRGWRVIPQGRTTPHWTQVCLLRRRQPRCGWILRSHVR